MTAVPRLYEVLFNRINTGVSAKGGLSEILFKKQFRLEQQKFLRSI